MTEITTTESSESRYRASYEFVIQFSGEDIPGLLQAFTEPLSKKNYNITNISLASSGGLQTTFITCRQHTQVEGQGVNRWEDQVKLEKILDETVKACQSKYFKEKDEVSPEKPKIIIRSQGILNDHNKTFLVYLRFKANKKPGQLHVIANELKDDFTVSQAFYWSDEKAISQGQEEEQKQTVCMQCRYIYHDAQEEDREGDSLRKAAKTFHESSTTVEDINSTTLKKKFGVLEKSFKEKLEEAFIEESSNYSEIETFHIKFDENHRNEKLRGHVYNGDKHSFCKNAVLSLLKAWPRGDSKN